MMKTHKIITAITETRRKGWRHKINECKRNLLWSGEEFKLESGNHSSHSDPARFWINHCESSCRSFSHKPGMCVLHTSQLPSLQFLLIDAFGNLTWPRSLTLDIDNTAVAQARQATGQWLMTSTRFVIDCHRYTVTNVSTAPQSPVIHR